MLPAPSFNNAFFAVNIQKHLLILCCFSNGQKASSNCFYCGFSINPLFGLNCYYKFVFFSAMKRQFQRIKMVELGKSSNFLSDWNAVKGKANITHFSNFM